MPAQQDRLHAGVELVRANGAHVEHDVLGHHVHHLLEDARRIGHRALEGVHTQHEIDEIGRLVEARRDAGRHILNEVGGAEDLPLRLDPPLLHAYRQLPAALRRGVHEDFAALETRDDRGRIEGAHFRARLHALQPFLEHDLGIAIGALTDHVAVDAAPGGVVDDDVAARANEPIDAAIDLWIAGGLLIGGPARMDSDHAGARVVAAVHILRDFQGGDREVRVLLPARHAASRRNGDDHLV